jgi:hypothetical protein
LSTLIFLQPLSLPPNFQRKYGLIQIFETDPKLLGAEQVEAIEEVADWVVRGEGTLGNQAADLVDELLIDFEGDFDEGSIGDLLLFRRGDLQMQL